MTSARFFSWKGTLPWAISTMRELSGWQQVTGVPKSARQAEMTVPRYPAPYTPICIAPPPSENGWCLGKSPNLYLPCRWHEGQSTQGTCATRKGTGAGHGNRYSDDRRALLRAAPGQHQLSQG